MGRLKGWLLLPFLHNWQPYNPCTKLTCEQSSPATGYATSGAGLFCFDSCTATNPSIPTSPVLPVSRGVGVKLPLDWRPPQIVAYLSAPQDARHGPLLSAIQLPQPEKRL